MTSKELAGTSINELKSDEANLSENLNEVQWLLREQKIASHRFCGKNTKSEADRERIATLQKQKEELSTEYAQASFRLRNRRTHGE